MGVQVPLDELRFLDDWQVAGMRGTGSVSITLAVRTLRPGVPRRRLPRICGRIARQRAQGIALEGALARVGVQPHGGDVDWHRPRRAGPLPRALGWPRIWGNDLQESARRSADPLDAGRGSFQDSVRHVADPRERRRDGRAWRARRRRHFPPTPITCNCSAPGCSWRRPMRLNGARKRSSYCSGILVRPRLWTASRSAGLARRARDHLGWRAQSRGSLGKLRATDGGNAAASVRGDHHP